MSEKGSSILDEAVRIAVSAGELLKDRLGTLSSGDIERKQKADYVTGVDRESEDFIINAIRESFPDHGIFTEESVKDEARGGSDRWIIDPLDGTTNFIHGFPAFSVSIALEREGRMVLGVVYDPLRHEIFHAEEGGGAFLNRRAISVSNPKSLDECLVATGFPFKMRHLLAPYLESFRSVFALVSDIRRAGSAALDLAWLAAGRLDAFWECGLMPWDVAAGSLLIKEAGGIITDFSGGPEAVWKGDIVAGTTIAHGPILEAVQKAFGSD